MGMANLPRPTSGKLLKESENDIKKSYWRHERFIYEYFISVKTTHPEIIITIRKWVYLSNINVIVIVIVMVATFIT